MFLRTSKARIHARLKECVFGLIFAIVTEVFREGCIVGEAWPRTAEGAAWLNQPGVPYQGWGKPYRVGTPQRNSGIWQPGAPDPAGGGKGTGKKQLWPS